MIVILSAMLLARVCDQFGGRGRNISLMVKSLEKHSHGRLSKRQKDVIKIHII
jgi:hypothetical protein